MPKYFTYLVTDVTLIVNDVFERKSENLFLKFLT